MCFIQHNTVELKINQGKPMLKYFKSELQIIHKERLEELLAATDGISYLAKMLNLHYTTVKGWEARGRISKEGAKMVEAHTALGEFYKAKYLRPDIQ